MKKTSLLLLLCSFSVFSFSQKTSFFSNAETGIQGHYGSFITDVPKADYLKDSYSYFGELFFSKPLYSDKLSNPKRFTRWGAGIFFGHTGSRQYIGKMGGIYPFLDFHLFGFKKFESRFRGGLGLGLVEKPYDAETNHKNALIGSTANIFIEANWRNSFELSERIKLNAGLSFNHLSNATIRLPNLGLNIPAFSAGLSYIIDAATTVILKHRDSVNKKIRFNLQATAGLKQSPTVESRLYPTGIFTIEAAKQRSFKTKWGIGIALLYDPALGDLYIDPVLSVDKTSFATLNVAPFISYERIIGRISIPIQLGVYILENPMKRVYQNLGIKYRLSNAWAVAGLLKTHMGRADFIHAGINYSFK